LAAASSPPASASSWAIAALGPAMLKIPKSLRANSNRPQMPVASQPVKYRKRIENLQN
jgi:hypothetical protein